MFPLNIWTKKKEQQKPDQAGFLPTKAQLLYYLYVIEAIDLDTNLLQSYYNPRVWLALHMVRFCNSSFQEVLLEGIASPVTTLRGISFSLLVSFLIKTRQKWNQPGCFLILCQVVFVFIQSRNLHNQSTTYLKHREA